ncbi:MAG: tRNA lysidine(34) synthetase TilS [Candidatus Neomarinimicrobiota bacterium]
MKWSPLAEKVHQMLVRKALLQQNDKLLITLSGGRDSVALLAIIMELKDYWNWDLVVGHINHDLRPGEDEKEAVFCREMAKNYGLTYVEETLDLLSPSFRKKYKNKSSQNPSLESLAREARYEIFHLWSQEFKCNAICSGHHMDDQAETVLYRMLTGSGLKGLLGIPSSRELFVRPLLEISRDEISDYIKQKDLLYYDDPTNKEHRFVRNKIRHAVLPSLRAMGFENPEKALSATATSLEEASIALEQIADEAYEEIISTSAKGLKLYRKGFVKLPRYIQKKILQKIFKEQLLLRQHLSEKQLDQLSTFIISAEQGASTDLFGVSLLKDREHIVFPFEKAKKVQTSFICKPGKINILEKELFIEIKIAKQDLVINDQFIAYFSIDLLGESLKFRTWENGDQMTVFGAGKNKKVSNILKDEKVGALEKQTYPVLVKDQSILWIPGVKRSNRYLVDEDSFEMLVFTYK